MTIRKVGVEEELLLVDPTTGQLKAVSHHAISRGDEDAPLEQELFLHQLETASAPCVGLDALRAKLVASRTAAVEAAGRADAALLAVGLPVLRDLGGEVTPKERYQNMMREYGYIGLGALTCGMHVHVDVGDDDEGVAVIDRMRPWLALLAAITSNSPYFDGVDTGYASWRTPVWERWPSAGATQEFGSVATYRATIAELIESGAALDDAMIYFDARLAASYPTVEIRVADVCTDVEDVLLYAALSRALVETSARLWRAGEPMQTWRVELLRGARWRAARYGLSDGLFDPRTRAVVPAKEALASLLTHVREALDDAGDTAYAAAGIERLLRDGTGAERQRGLDPGTGDLTAVVDDLRSRTAP